MKKSQIKRLAENDLDEADIEIEEIEERYIPCPFCGSSIWEKLYTDKFGDPKNCDECRGYEKH